MAELQSSESSLRVCDETATYTDSPLLAAAESTFERSSNLDICTAL